MVGRASRTVSAGCVPAARVSADRPWRYAAAFGDLLSQEGGGPGCDSVGASTWPPVGSLYVFNSIIGSRRGIRDASLVCIPVCCVPAANGCLPAGPSATPLLSPNCLDPIAMCVRCIAKARTAGRAVQAFIQGWQAPVGACRSARCFSSLPEPVVDAPARPNELEGKVAHPSLLNGARLARPTVSNRHTCCLCIDHGGSRLADRCPLFLQRTCSRHSMPSAASCI